MTGHVLETVAASPSGQANLAAIVDDHPLTLGLAELLAYFQVEYPGLDMIVDPDRTDLLVYPRVHVPGHTQARVPRVTFVRDEGGTAAGKAKQE